MDTVRKEVSWEELKRRCLEESFLIARGHMFLMHVYHDVPYMDRVRFLAELASASDQPLELREVARNILIKFAIDRHGGQTAEELDFFCSFFVASPRNCIPIFAPGEEWERIEATFDFTKEDYVARLDAMVSYIRLRNRAVIALVNAQYFDPILTDSIFDAVPVIYKSMELKDLPHAEAWSRIGPDMSEEVMEGLSQDISILKEFMFRCAGGMSDLIEVASYSALLILISRVEHEMSVAKNLHVSAS